MNSVTRYDPNYAVISPADDLAVEAADGMFVRSSDYDALAAECQLLRALLRETRSPVIGVLLGTKELRDRIDAALASSKETNHE